MTAAVFEAVIVHRVRNEINKTKTTFQPVTRSWHKPGVAGWPH